jgi:hypothetical protein
VKRPKYSDGTSTIATEPEMIGFRKTLGLPFRPTIAFVQDGKRIRVAYFNNKYILDITAHIQKGHLNLLEYLSVQKKKHLVFHYC